jgi:SAM-dependent methyltransferase
MTGDAGTDIQVDDWDRHWTDLSNANLLNPAQQYRHHLVLRALNLDATQQARVLDIGSGVGEFLRILHGAHPTYPMLGIEVSSRGIEIARRRVPQALFVQRDLIAGTEKPGAHQAFATHAVCSEVLEHVSDPVRLLKNVRPYLADGCRVVITVPGGPRSRFDVHIGHRRHFTPAELHQLLTDAGFEVEMSTGAGFPFFNLYRVLVFLRGKRLVDDATGEPSILFKLASAIFRALFKLNLSRSSFGWQTFAVAHKPARFDAAARVRRSVAP